jgi:hypothetical protein
LGQKLTFKVVKKDTGGKDIESNAFEFTIPAITPQTIPQITSVDFDGATGKPTFWTQMGTKTGTIKGSFLQDGVPSLVGADSTIITNISAVKEGSTDSALNFKMTLAKPLSSGQKLVFKVVTKSKEGKDVESKIFELTVPQSGAKTGKPN